METSTNTIPKKKRKKLGRQARQRQQKARAIEEAAAAAAAAAASTSAPSIGGGTNVIDNQSSSELGGSQSSQVHTSRIATDRSYVLDSVKQLSDLSPADCQRLVGQLGYLPGNALCVAARVKDMFKKASSGQPPVSYKSPCRSVQPQLSLSAQRDVISISSEDFRRRFEALQERSIASSPSSSTTTKQWDDLMEQPLVLKLYPLAIREEADGTRSRRKRKRNNNNSSSSSKNKHFRPGPSTVSAPAPSQTGDVILKSDTGDHPSEPTDEAASKSTDSTTNIDDDENTLLEPFPTIYWVTHPYAKALISKLELERLGSTYEKCLQRKDWSDMQQSSEQREIAETGSSSIINVEDGEDEETALSPLDYMKRAHASYGQERYDLLTTKDIHWIQSRGSYGSGNIKSSTESSLSQSSSWTAAFDPTTRGVAGIRNPAGVKCLHAHAGHYWSGCSDNIIGHWVADRVADMWLSHLEEQAQTQQRDRTRKG